MYNSLYLKPLKIIKVLSGRQKSSLTGREHETEPKPGWMSDRRQITGQGGQVQLSDFPVKLSEGIVGGTPSQKRAGKEMEPELGIGGCSGKVRMQGGWTWVPSWHR